MKATVENLMAAEQQMASVVAELREAYAKSEPLVEIIVLPLLENAVVLEQRLKALNKALHHGNSGRE
jgi:hypothetical protein